MFANNRLSLMCRLLSPYLSMHYLLQKLQSLYSQNPVYMKLRDADVVAAVRSRIEVLEFEAKLTEMGEDIKAEYKDVFEPINHVDNLPTEVTCSIKHKNADKQIASRSYSCPRKYRQAWKDLIDQHLQAGRIRPSSSPYSSLAFLIPKPDSTVLPRWVNDFRELNANTVVDRHPLPRVDDILTDAACGKYWSKLDMTDAFFHTRLDEASIPLTAVNTPFGLYEWTVMLQGLKNSLPVHQRRVNAALRKFLGEFCHIYLDDIIIWSETLEGPCEACSADHGYPSKTLSVM